MAKYRVVADSFWDGLQIRQKGEIIEGEFKIAPKSQSFKPGLEKVEEEKPKGKAD